MKRIIWDKHPSWGRIYRSNPDSTREWLTEPVPDPISDPALGLGEVGFLGGLHRFARSIRYPSQICRDRLPSARSNVTSAESPWVRHQSLPSGVRIRSLIRWGLPGGAGISRSETRLRTR